MTTREDIADWFVEGKSANATHMIIVCDTFDYEDYPVYVYDHSGGISHCVEKYDGKNMQKVMEVYNLNERLIPQLEEVRAFNY